VSQVLEPQPTATLRRAQLPTVVTLDHAFAGPNKVEPTALARVLAEFGPAPNPGAPPLIASLLSLRFAGVLDHSWRRRKERATRGSEPQATPFASAVCLTLDKWGSENPFRIINAGKGISEIPERLK
jgi:hypothetical protein